MYVGIFWNSVVFWSNSAFSSALKEPWWLVFWVHYLKLGNIKSGNQTVSIAVLFLSCAGVWLLSYIYNMLTHSAHCHWINSITGSALVLLEVRNLVQKFIMEYCLQRDLQKGKGNIFFIILFKCCVCSHVLVQLVLPIFLSSWVCCVKTPQAVLFLLEHHVEKNTIVRQSSLNERKSKF